jgi:PRC-barrel domain
VGLLAVALIGLNEALAQNNNKNKRDYPTLLDTSDAKGARVKNLQNEDIGAIDELLIEPPSGRVRFAIVNVGGFLGIGGTRVAVPWTAFTDHQRRRQARLCYRCEQRLPGESASGRRQKVRFPLRPRVRRTGIYLLARDLAPLNGERPEAQVALVGA